MSLILALQAAVVAHLEGLPALAGVPVLARRPQVPMNELVAALMRLERGIYVAPPLPGRLRGNSAALFAEAVAVRVTCFERPLATQGAALGAEALAEEVLHALHHWQPGGEAADLCGMLVANDEPLTDATNEQDGIVAYDVSFTCPGAWLPRV